MQVANKREARTKIEEYKEAITKAVRGIEKARQLIAEHTKKEEIEKPLPPTERRVSMEEAFKEKFGRKEVILKSIPKNYMSTVLIMRWIEFMFERVKRDKITLLLDYYKSIGWISEEVKAEIMSHARGTVQDVSKYNDISAEEVKAEYHRIEDWRLSAEDHLKSLLFIEKIAGKEVNKDELNALEQQIAEFKRALEGYHKV
jgi:flagellar protein FlaD